MLNYSFNHDTSVHLNLLTVHVSVYGASHFISTVTRLRYNHQPPDQVSNGIISAEVINISCIPSLLRKKERKIRMAAE